MIRLLCSRPWPSLQNAYNADPAKLSRGCVLRTSAAVAQPALQIGLPVGVRDLVQGAARGPFDGSPVQQRGERGRRLAHELPQDTVVGLLVEEPCGAGRFQ